MCYKLVSNDPYMLKYCLDRYKTQEIGDKAVDVFLPTLKFVLDCFVTSKMIKNLMKKYIFNDDIRFVNEDSNYISNFLLMKWVCIGYSS